MAPEVAKGTFLLVSTPTRPGAPELLRILALYPSPQGFGSKFQFSDTAGCLCGAVGQPSTLTAPVLRLCHENIKHFQNCHLIQSHSSSERSESSSPFH